MSALFGCVLGYLIGALLHFELFILVVMEMGEFVGSPLGISIGISRVSLVEYQLEILLGMFLGL